MIPVFRQSTIITNNNEEKTTLHTNTLILCSNYLIAEIYYFRLKQQKIRTRTKWKSHYWTKQRKHRIDSLSYDSDSYQSLEYGHNFCLISFELSVECDLLIVIIKNKNLFLAAQVKCIENIVGICFEPL